MRRLVSLARLAVLAIPAAACAAAGAADGERTVEIRISRSRFEPAAVRVSPGAPVRFVIRNDDPIDHEFIVGDEEVHRRHAAGNEPHHGAVPGEVSVPPRQVRETTFRFDQPGTYAFACHLPGHLAYGMQGQVYVRD